MPYLISCRTASRSESAASIRKVSILVVVEVPLVERSDPPPSMNPKRDVGILLILSIISLGLCVAIVAAVTLMTQGQFRKFKLN
jgi:hypothetical protein